MRISVIIPIGDAERWRVCEKCILGSIARKVDNVDFEILPCFDLEHKGAYLARNDGLAKAKGDWIAWVDCDDIVESEWARNITEAAIEHSDVDIIQFDTFENWNGNVKHVAYRYKGVLDGAAFAHELLRNDGMPAWLWTRVFKRELFDGLCFEGRVKHDYGMFLQLLPRVRSVWSIGKPLYRYNRHGRGLSNYAQGMDYAAAGSRFETLIKALPNEWHKDGFIGLALTMADVARHSSAENGSRRWVRKYLWNVLSDLNVPLRLKVKSLLAALDV